MFTIATGRAASGVRALVEKLSIRKGMPLILYNGAVVAEFPTFELLSKQEIADTDVHHILTICKEHPVAVYAYCYNGAFQSGFQVAPLEFVSGWSPRRRGPVDFNRLPVEWQRSFSHGIRSDYSTMVIEALGASATLNVLIDHITSACSVVCTRSGDRYIEVRPSGSSKGNALRVVASFLCLGLKDILALGDNDNDAEMLATAGIGVAIQGASPSALYSCNFVCHYGAVDGALEVMQLIRHARRFYYDKKSSIGSRF